MINLKKIIASRKKIKEEEPLIHAITNPLAINILANAILFQNAKAICAEYPDEIEDIVPKAQALSLNLGNITKARIESIELASKIANDNKIPTIIDLVGIGISKVRYDFCLKLLEKYKYKIIKGNSSEILTLAGEKSNAKGIDVGDKDKISSANLGKIIKVAVKLSQKYQASILITGKIDILVKNKTYYLIENGTEDLTKITATGCMLTGLISTFMAVTDEISAAILGLLILEVSAELAEKNGPYSFFINLMDNIGKIEDKDIMEKAKIREGNL